MTYCPDLTLQGVGGFSLTKIYNILVKAEDCEREKKNTTLIVQKIAIFTVFSLFKLDLRCTLYRVMELMDIFGLRLILTKIKA